MTPAQQRERDAALFEDWSPWVPRILVIQHDNFELRQAGAPATDLVRNLPDIREYRWHRYDQIRAHLLPLARWRELRAALPAIASAHDQYIAERAAERERVDAADRERRARISGRYVCAVADLPAIGSTVRHAGSEVVVQGFGRHWQEHDGPIVCYVYTRPLR